MRYAGRTSVAMPPNALVAMNRRILTSGPGSKQVIPVFADSLVGGVDPFQLGGDLWMILDHDQPPAIGPPLS